MRCRRQHDPFLDLVPPEGIKLTPRHYAYLKISEGCNNRCTFCIIPKLRGDLVSRPAGDVLREAERLVKAGVKELLVISQDTSAYGVDLSYAESEWNGRAGAGEISRPRARAGRARRLGAAALCLSLPARRRRHPADGGGQGAALSRHPVPARKPRRAQAHEAARPRRKRRSSASGAWRAICPELTIRSTFIVGFPGETDADFEQLLDWLDEAELDRVGCFRYEPVKGATANDLAAPVPDDVKKARWHRFMARQQAISTRRLKRKVGTRQQVIIDATGPTVAKGRSKGDAPEIDGAVYVASRRPLRVGEIATVKIERAEQYDLHGTAVGF